MYKVLVNNISLYSLSWLLATYLMGCEKVNAEMRPDIYGLCWMDKDTLIIADFNGQQLVKYTVNTTARTCTGEVMDSGYYVYSLSCSEDGKVYVTELTRGKLNINVTVYDVNTGDKEVWDTNVLSETDEVDISLNSEFIVISSGNSSYVYNRDRVFQYKVTHHKVKRFFRQTYVTDTSVFWGAEVNGGEGVFIMNLLTNDTQISKEFRPEAVAGSKKGYVYVTDVNRRDVGVYSPDGTFLHNIYVDPIVGGDLFYSAAVKLSVDEALIAFSTGNRATPVAVYKTHQ